LKQNVPALTTSLVDNKSYLCASTGSACFQSQETSRWTGILPKRIYLAMLPAVYSRIKPQQTLCGLHGWPQLQCGSRIFKFLGWTKLLAANCCAVRHISDQDSYKILHALVLLKD